MKSLENTQRVDRIHHTNDHFPEGTEGRRGIEREEGKSRGGAYPLAARSGLEKMIIGVILLATMPRSGNSFLRILFEGLVSLLRGCNLSEAVSNWYGDGGCTIFNVNAGGNQRSLSLDTMDRGL